MVLGVVNSTEAGEIDMKRMLTAPDEVVNGVFNLLQETQILHAEVHESGRIVNASLLVENLEALQILAGFVALNVPLDTVSCAATFDKLDSVTTFALYRYLSFTRRLNALPLRVAAIIADVPTGASDFTTILCAAIKVIWIETVSTVALFAADVSARQWLFTFFCTEYLSPASSFDFVAPAFALYNYLFMAFADTIMAG